ASLAEKTLAWLDNPAAYDHVRTRFAEVHDSLRMNTPVIASEAIQRIANASDQALTHYGHKKNSDTLDATCTDL
ncbi:MAG: hypothetical protein QMC46_02105, partial [Burkholderiaceae bacterium]